MSSEARSSELHNYNEAEFRSFKKRGKFCLPFQSTKANVLFLILAILVLTITGILVYVALYAAGLTGWSGMRLTGNCYRASAQSSNPLEVFAKGNKDFSIRFYQAASVKKAKAENLIMSPLSVSAVMALASLGAQGQTQEEILAALSFPCTNDVLIKGFRDLLKVIDDIERDNKISLSMANKIYVNQRYQLSQEFKTNGWRYFRASSENLNFGESVLASNTINIWVEEQTNGKIKELIDAGAITETMKLVLVNAIYFKGSWKYPFEKFGTEKDVFVGRNGNSSILFMNAEQDLQTEYLKDLRSNIVRLPYSGDKMAMYIILPDSDTNLETVETQLGDLRWPNLKDRTPTNVFLKLPKFKLESDYDLTPILDLMGASSLSDPQSADFSRMVQDVSRLNMDQMIQKALIEVTEEGTEASAATGATFRSAFQTSIICNRPFFFVIRDDISNVSYFLGRYVSGET